MKITPQQIVKNLRAWAKALRSGKYKQGTGSLRDHEDAYCCLGVAHVCLAGTRPPIATATDDRHYARVRNLCGLDKERQGFFINLNDNIASRFSAIAGHVEKLADQKAAALKKPKVRK